MSFFQILLMRRQAASCRRPQRQPGWPPRLNASMPSCPVPPNRSSTEAPGRSNCRMLNRASFTRSVVGRVRMPSGVFEWSPWRNLRSLSCCLLPYENAGKRPLRASLGRTCSSSSRPALPMADRDLNFFSNSCFRLGPTPGIWSSSE